MKNPRSFLSTLIAILFLFSLPTSVSAQGKNKDITGSWEIAASSNDGDQDSVWKFARSGDKYTGEMIADGSDEKIELKKHQNRWSKNCVQPFNVGTGCELKNRS